MKNYRLAIEALARIGESRDSRPPPFLALVGDGSNRAALEDLARSKGVSGRVRFLGWREDADTLYPAFDIFTLTSRSEGTSISLLESMSCGVCPVVTDVGANRNVLGPSLEHLLVPDCDEASLAATWRRCLDDSVFRDRQAQLARQRVLERFSLHRMVDEHVSLYEDLCGTAFQ